MRNALRHPFWQAVGILLLAFVVIEWGIPALPGSAMVPKSVVLQYMDGARGRPDLRERQ